MYTYTYIFIDRKLFVYDRNKRFINTMFINEFLSVII